MPFGTYSVKSEDNFSPPGGIGAFIIILFMLASKHQSPKKVILSGKVILVRLLQPKKHNSPKEVIPSGKVMLVRLLQL